VSELRPRTDLTLRVEMTAANRLSHGMAIVTLVFILLFINLAVLNLLFVEIILISLYNHFIICVQ
jgi:hypothetical protein